MGSKLSSAYAGRPRTLSDQQREALEQRVAEHRVAVGRLHDLRMRQERHVQTAEALLLVVLVGSALWAFL